jgi:hypothetical protein
MLHIRKTLLVRDIVTSEMGHIVDPPTVRAVALAVMGNPFSSSTVAPVYIRCWASRCEPPWAVGKPSFHQT